jgi:hypothetical protein
VFTVRYELGLQRKRFMFCPQRVKVANGIRILVMSQNTKIYVLLYLIINLLLRIWTQDRMGTEQNRVSFLSSLH